MSDTPSTPQAGSLVTVSTAYLWQGPLPHPDAIAKYQTTVADAGERLFKMAEAEQASRIRATHENLELERVDTIAHYQSVRLGQIFAFVLLLAIFGGVIVCAIYDRPWIATILSGCGLLGIVKAFIGREDRRGKTNRKSVGGA